VTPVSHFFMFWIYAVIPGSDPITTAQTRYCANNIARVVIPLVANVRGERNKLYSFNGGGRDQGSCVAIDPEARRGLN
jgi:hypothetical protein